MDSLKNLLVKNLSGRRTLNIQVSTALIVERANQLLVERWGRQIGGVAKAVSFSGSCLTVHCVTPIMAQEMNFHRLEYLAELNKSLTAGAKATKLKIIIKNLEENQEPC